MYCFIQGICCVLNEQKTWFYLCAMRPDACRKENVCLCSCVVAIRTGALCLLISRQRCAMVPLIMWPSHVCVRPAGASCCGGAQEGGREGRGEGGEKMLPYAARIYLPLFGRGSRLVWLTRWEGPGIAMLTWYPDARAPEESKKAVQKVNSCSSYISFISCIRLTGGPKCREGTQQKNALCTECWSAPFWPRNLGESSPVRKSAINDLRFGGLMILGRAWLVTSTSTATERQLPNPTAGCVIRAQLSWEKCR